MGWDKNATDPLKWATEMKDIPKDAVKIFAFSIYNGVVERTPVDTGQARSNWLVTVGKEDKDTFNKADVTYKKIKKRKGENAGKTITKRSVKLGSSLKRMMKQAELEIAFSDYNGDETIYIQNNTPYIRKLEFGGYGDGPKTTGGFSKQAPHGMVGVTLAKADTLWERAVAAAKDNQDRYSH